MRGDSKSCKPLAHIFIYMRDDMKYRELFASVCLSQLGWGERARVSSSCVVSVMWPQNWYSTWRWNPVGVFFVIFGLSVKSPGSWFAQSLSNTTFYACCVVHQTNSRPESNARVTSEALSLCLLAWHKCIRVLIIKNGSVGPFSMCRYAIH